MSIGSPSALRTTTGSGRSKSRGGKVLLLSTDGLHDYVRDERIREIVLKFEPKEACERLVEEALNSGSGDNITVIVVKFD